MNNQLLQSIIESDELGLIESKPFQNHSIFQGWNQYFDENGIEWRTEEFGYMMTKFYKCLWSGNNFVYDGWIANEGGESIKELHDLYLDQQV